MDPLYIFGLLRCIQSTKVSSILATYLAMGNNIAVCGMYPESLLK